MQSAFMQVFWVAGGGKGGISMSCQSTGIDADVKTTTGGGTIMDIDIAYADLIELLFLGIAIGHILCKTR